MKTGWIVAAIFVLSVLAVRAQDAGGWTAYAREKQYGPQVYEFNQAGQLLDTLNVTVPEDFRAAADIAGLSLSPSGRYMTYALVNGPADLMQGLEDPYQEVLVVYDRTAQQIVLESRLPEYAESTAVVVDEARGQMAVGVYQNTITTSDSGERVRELEQNIAIQLYTFGAENGEPTAILTDFPELLARYAAYVEIHTLHDGVVTFSLLDAQGDMPLFSAYNWDTASNMVTDEPRYTLTSDNLAATGEAVRAWSNNNYPDAEAVGSPFIYFQMNVLEVWDTNEQAWQPFYNDARRSLFGAHFVQNGERILAGAADADQNYAWLLFERDGTLVDEVPQSRYDGQLNGLIMTPDGFIQPVSDCGADGCTSTDFIEYNTHDGLKTKHTILTLDGGQEIVSFQPAQPVKSEYPPFTILPPNQP